MAVRRCEIESPVGTLTLFADEHGLSRILFEGEVLDDTGAEVTEVVDAPDDPVLTEAVRQLEEYFAGSRDHFELPLHLEGNNFEREAWRALAAIPYGETISYGDQAAYIGRPGAFRAVGGANGRNPLPIVLPCHRVVGADGSLVGFGGGLAVKQWLLDHERGVPQLPFES